MLNFNGGLVLDNRYNIKVTFFFLETTGQHVTVRGCALDSGTLTTDTEIIRMSHCGGFYFDDK